MKEIISNLPDYGVLVQSRQQRLRYGHRHSHPSIIFVASGSGIFEINDKRYSLNSNTVIALQRDQSHKLMDKPRKAMNVFSLYFSKSILSLNKYIFDYLFASQQPFNLPIYYAENNRRNLRQMLYEQNTKPPGYKFALQQNLNLTIIQLYRALLTQSKKPAFEPDNVQKASAVLDFIARNPHEQYRLSDAAKMTRVSQRQFTNLCRKSTNKSFVQFLNSQRCEKAKQLLIETDISVAAIAFEIGYEELSTFYRAFKKHHGFTPLSLRK